MSVNPLPLVAVSNLAVPLPTLADSAIPDAAALDRRVALLTISAVDLTEEAEYMAPTITAAALREHGLGWVASGVNEFSLAHGWIVDAQARWGYLLYAWLGSEAESERSKLNAAIASVEFR